MSTLVILAPAQPKVLVVDQVTAVLVAVAAQGPSGPTIAHADSVSISNTLQGELGGAATVEQALQILVDAYRRSVGELDFSNPDQSALAGG